MRLAFGILFLALGLFGLWVHLARRAQSPEEASTAQGTRETRAGGSIGWSIANLALGAWFLARHFGVIG